MTHELDYPPARRQVLGKLVAAGVSLVWVGCGGKETYTPDVPAAVTYPPVTPTKFAYEQITATPTPESKPTEKPLPPPVELAPPEPLPPIEGAHYFDVQGEIEGYKHGWVRVITGPSLNDVFGEVKVSKLELNTVDFPDGEAEKRLLKLGWMSMWRGWVQDNPDDRGEVLFKEFMARLNSGEDMSFNIGAIVMSQEEATQPEVRMVGREESIARIDPTKPIEVVFRGYTQNASDKGTMRISGFTMELCRRSDGGLRAQIWVPLTLTDSPNTNFQYSQYLAYALTPIIFTEDQQIGSDPVSTGLWPAPYSRWESKFRDLAVAWDENNKGMGILTFPESKNYTNPGGR